MQHIQTTQQYTQLNQILSAVNGTILGKYLGLDTLKKVKTLGALHTEYAAHTEVLNYREFVSLLMGLAPVEGTNEELFLYPNLLTTEPLGGIAKVTDGTRPKSLPISQKQLDLMRTARAEKLIELFKNKSLVKKLKVINFYQNPALEVLTVNRVWHTGLSVLLAQPRKTLFSKGQPAIPSTEHFLRKGRLLNEQLEVYSKMLTEEKNAEVLYAFPFQLSDFACFLEKEYGRRMRLVDFLPHLHLIMLDVLDYATHEMSLKSFLQNTQAPIYTELYRADGIFGQSVDQTTPEVIQPNLNAGVFYEFIPLADFYALKGEVKPNYRRLCVDQLEVGEEYGVVVNSIAGLIGYNTKLVVRVTELIPLQFKVLGQLSALDGLGQNVTARQTQRIMISLNKVIQKSYGLHAVHYMVGEHHNQEELIWVIELNTPPKDVNLQVLRGIANSIHNALAKENITYRKSFEKPHTLAPIFSFVAPGVFLGANLSNAHCLDFSADGQRIKHLLNQAKQNVVKLRAARIKPVVKAF